MKLLPHAIYLMSLQGRKTLRGRPLLEKEEALAKLKRLTGQNFCADAEQWKNWLRHNWRKCYSREETASPAHLVTIDPSCLTPSVKALAQAAYEYRLVPSGELDPARLAVLADALEEAGCQDQGLLSHLREQGSIHVRGCWVLDALLGRE